MDWKVYVTTFVTIFLAELGDKTQFAALAFGAKESATGSVILGVISGLGLAGILGVLGGRLISQWIPAKYLSWASGFIFILVGVYIIYQTIQSTNS